MMMILDYWLVFNFLLFTVYCLHLLLSILLWLQDVGRWRRRSSRCRRLTFFLPRWVWLLFMLLVFFSYSTVSLLAYAGRFGAEPGGDIYFSCLTGALDLWEVFDVGWVCFFAFCLCASRRSIYVGGCWRRDRSRGTDRGGYSYHVFYKTNTLASQSNKQNKQADNREKGERKPFWKKYRFHSIAPLIPPRASGLGVFDSSRINGNLIQSSLLQGFLIIYAIATTNDCGRPATTSARTSLLDLTL